MFSQNTAHICCLKIGPKFTHSFCRQEVAAGSEAIQIPSHVLSCWPPALGIGCSVERTLHNLVHRYLVTECGKHPN